MNARTAELYGEQSNIDFTELLVNDEICFSAKFLKDTMQQESRSRTIRRKDKHVEINNGACDDLVKPLAVANQDKRSDKALQSSKPRSSNRTASFLKALFYKFQRLCR